MATTIVPTFKESVDGSGACREFWIKMEGLVGLAAAASATVVNVAENPFDQDLLIIQALIKVNTASGAVDTNMDIGLGDDEDGSSAATELATDLEDEELNVVQTVELMAPRVINATPIRPVWKAPNADHDAADSWLVTTQNGNIDASALVCNLLVKVIPVKDLE